MAGKLGRGVDDRVDDPRFLRARQVFEPGAAADAL
jgi:hypothetical protein